MDWRRAAPARQQRAVDVEAAQDRRLEEAPGQDVTVGHDHGGIEIERLEGLRRLVRLQGAGRANRQAELLGEFVHRRLALLLAATRGFRGSRIDAGDVVTGFDQGAERGYGEGGSAEERNLHRRTL